MLELKDFSCSFGAKTVLSGLSFTLLPGGYLSIIGPNGAGKSSLLKSLLRLAEGGRSGGTARLGGRDLSGYGQKELARLISYVPQAGGWIPPFTVREFARLARYPYSSPLRGGSKDDSAAIERAMTLAGVADLAERPLRNLSGGERQKAYLAAALAQGGDMMLLDEPTSFLDPRHAAEISALLKKLNRLENLTMLVVTHDLNQALDSGGSVLVLREGRQLFYGPAINLMQGDILERAYRHKFSRFKHPENGQPLIMAEKVPDGAASSAGGRP